MASSNSISLERLHELLQYDAHSGAFTWKIKPASKIIAGSVAGRLATGGYWRIGIDKKIYAAHRLAWFYVHGKWPDGEIDHINGDRLDNRIANLRDVSKSINMQNLRSARRDNKTAALLGVSLHKRTGTYTAHIQLGGKQKNLGYFKTAEEAHQAYLEAKRRIHLGCTI